MRLESDDKGTIKASQNTQESKSANDHQNPFVTSTELEGQTACISPSSAWNESKQSENWLSDVHPDTNALSSRVPGAHRHEVT